MVNDDPCWALNVSSATRAQFIWEGWGAPADPSEAITAIVPVHDTAWLPAAWPPAAGRLDPHPASSAALSREALIARVSARPLTTARSVPRWRGSGPWR